MAAGLVALGTDSASHAGEPSKGDWVDAHTHVWTSDLKSYPLAGSYTAASMQPAHFTPEDLFLHTGPAGVKRIVLIQMSYYGFDNSYMTDMMAKYPGVFGGVGIVDHHSSSLRSTVIELREKGVRGLRLYPLEAGKLSWPEDDAMIALWKLAGELDLAVCLLINPTDLPMAAAMCDKFPTQRVVIDHFARIGTSGSIDPEALSTLASLARYKNVFVKTSAFYALGKKRTPYDDLIPMIRRLLDAYGPERLMWASDNPYQVQPPHRYIDSLALIRDRIDFLSASDKNHLLRDTATRVFFDS
jgi:predicted TIM-barrel fold metal-dependent hydrolase